MPPPPPLPPPPPPAPPFDPRWIARPLVPPAVAPPPPTPEPPLRCQFGDGTVSVLPTSPPRPMVAPGVGPPGDQGTPGVRPFVAGEAVPGVFLELCLPGTTFLAGAVIQPEVRVRNTTSAVIEVLSGLGANLATTSWLLRTFGAARQERCKRDRRLRRRVQVGRVGGHIRSRGRLPRVHYMWWIPGSSPQYVVVTLPLAGCTESAQEPTSFTHTCSRTDEPPLLIADAVVRGFGLWWRAECGQQ